MYNFVRFNNLGPSNDSMISINKSYEITLSSAFCYENKIFSYNYAILFWDETKKAIGIHFTNKKEEKGAYKVQHRASQGKGARIVGGGFLKGNNIDVKKYAGRYSWKKYEDQSIGTLFVVELEGK